MRIRRVTYDLGNVIERQEYLDGRYGAPGEKRAKKKKATPEEVEQVKSEQQKDQRSTIIYRDFMKKGRE